LPELRKKDTTNENGCVLQDYDCRRMGGTKCNGLAKTESCMAGKKCCDNLSEYKCFYDECNIKTQAPTDEDGCVLQDYDCRRMGGTKCNGLAKTESCMAGKKCCDNLSEYDCFKSECNPNPKGVTVTHTKHPWAKSGRYFYFTKKAWVDEIGAYGKDGKFFVNQWRDAKLIWSGVVIVWDNGNGIHGRREPYGAAKANQWKAGDVITKKAGVTVIHANRHNWPTGMYFFFLKNEWNDKIGTMVNYGKFRVNQMRNGKLIWSGLVTTIDHKEGLFGRREPYGVAKANQWKAGDVITKIP